MTRRSPTVATKLAILGSLLAGSVHVRSTVVPQALKLSFQPYAGEQHESMPVEVLKLVVDGALNRSGGSVSRIKRDPANMVGFASPG